MDRTQLASTLLELLEQETGERHERLDDDVNLRDELKLDSVDMVSLLLHIENRLHIKIESGDVENVVRVGDLLDLLEAKLAAPSHQTA